MAYTTHSRFSRKRRQKSDKTPKTAKKHRYKFVNPKICTTFAVANHKGTLAEWLGNGLQNRVRRFESARYLKEKKSCSKRTTLFFFYHYQIRATQSTDKHSHLGLRYTQKVGRSNLYL